MGKGGRQTAAGGCSHPQGEQMGKGKERGRQGSKLPSLLACTCACICNCFVRGLVESFARYMCLYTHYTLDCAALQAGIIHFTVWRVIAVKKGA